MVRHPHHQMTRLLERTLSAPPERLRRGPFRPGVFGPRSTRLTSNLGLLLGVAFGVCFVTGLLSHLIQHPPGWFWWPSRPVWLYRATQGVHVATGLASIPLLGAKLWSVYPRLFTWPPARTLRHAAERAGVALLVAGGLFQLVSGVLNVARWYTPMPFFFTTGHYWVAWLTIGALLVHVAVQLPVVRDALRRRPAGPDAGRRQVLLAAGVAAGLITLTTVGETVRPLSRAAVLAPRRPTIGPQGLPVNKTALGAGVRQTAADPAYALVLTGPAGLMRLDLGALNALPQHTVVLPIACVEGWSASGTWTGVRRPRAGRGAGRVAADGRSLRQLPGRAAADRRPVHPDRVAAAGRDVAPRPRIPGPADRPEPARGAADEMGRAPDRTGAAMNRWRAALLVTGVLAMSYAVIGAVADLGGKIGGVLVFLIAVLVAHDAIWLPLVLLGGTLLNRIVPARHRPVVRVAAIVAVALTVAALPLALGLGRTADNPSALPLHYGRNLALVLLGVAAATGLTLLLRNRSSRKHSISGNGGNGR
jgi:hypothetical protein